MRPIPDTSMGPANTEPPCSPTSFAVASTSSLAK
jgi:hypothetical protein